MENKELINIKQLPIIEETLQSISEEIDADIAEAKQLICTEESYKFIKETRAKLNNKFKTLEEKRKEVKNAILSPYNEFEAIYKKLVSDKFKNADIELKNKIESVENGLKDKKTEKIEEYFEQYKKEKEIDFIEFKHAGIIVNLSASEKSLKEQVKAFIDKIAEDLMLIDIQEHKTEILVEYKKTLNVNQAITTVVTRHQAIEAEREKLKEGKKEPITENHEEIIDLNTGERIEFRIIEEKIKITLEIFATESEYEDLEKYLNLKNIEFRKGV